MIYQASIKLTVTININPYYRKWQLTIRHTEANARKFVKSGKQRLTRKLMHANKWLSNTENH